MRRFAFAFVIMIMPAAVAATEIKLDDSWVPKLGILCDAARYASRMTAEPICAELGAMVAKAQDEAKANATEGKAQEEAPPK